MRKNIAVILSGGVGSRLGLSIPKQFFKVAGKMVIEHTIDTFEHNARIDEIAVVSNPFYVADMEAMIIRNGWKKVKKILLGGKERYLSSLSAIQAYDSSDNVNLIFHDAVRPLVSQRIIDDVIEALNNYEAVDVALPSADTIIRVEGSFISDIPDRSKLQRGQTPQAFHLETIKKAYEIALRDSQLKVTDDCGIIKKYTPQIPVFVVKGEESNMKLTYKEDTYLLDKFFQLRKSELNESIDLSLLKNKVAVIFGGNYGIGFDIAQQLENAQCLVYRFSRKLNNTNVTDKDSVAKALNQVAQKEGCIDYIINSAGVLNREPLVNMNYDTITKAVNTNYLGTINVALESYPYLKESKGKLLFFTSSSYTRGRAFYSIYSSTKAAIVNFVQAIAQEWEPFGICVNCINPERTKTPMRVQNFGIEPDDTLLSSEKVANISVKSLLTDFTGQVIDIKLKTNNE